MGVLGLFPFLGDLALGLSLKLSLFGLIGFGHFES